MKTKNKLGIVFFPAFDWAISPTHPERQERLLYTQDQIFEEGLEDIEGIEFFNPGIAKKEDIQRVHFVVPSVESILTNSHFISAGGSIKALESVMDKRVDKAFAIIRPPGHHAKTVVYGDRGFCIINMEAVMIEKIRKTYGNLKVAIIDTDCHHGDGTQNIYWNDPNTLFISVHQDGRTLYPGTGFVNELGGPSAYGYNINIPLPPNTGDEGYDYVTDNIILPILKDFKPDLIINSAGQDNHYSDPLTNMNLSARGYARLTKKLNANVAVLEGGYSIEGALPYINLGIILSMAGLPFSNVIEPDFTESKISQTSKTTNYIKNLSKEIMSNWNNKEKLAYEKFKNEDSYIERKRIYYDTSNISEQQTIHYKKCDNCPGHRRIESNSSLGANILAITIPLDACNSCILEGRKHFNKDYRNKYKNIYLQDRTTDEYKIK